MNKDFVSEILQKIGYIAAFAVAFSQYFLKDTFKTFFLNNPEIYSACSLFSLLISVVLIIAIFSQRHTLSLKIYFSKKKKNAYYASLGKPDTERLPEPLGITLNGIAFVLIILSVICFFFFLSQSSLIVRAITYVVLIISIVSAATIYSTRLYLENAWAAKEAERNSVIMNKIKDHVAGHIKILSSWRDDTNPFKPLHRMIIERESQEYDVTADRNDPESLFHMQKRPPQPQPPLTPPQHQ